MADKWKLLGEQITKWLAETEDDVVYETLSKVRAFMAELDKVLAPETSEPLVRQEWAAPSPWEYTEEAVLTWAQAALSGAPPELVELCAQIAWSVLQGSNPDPDERFVRGDAIKAVAGLFGNETAAQSDVYVGDVVGGIVG